MKRYILPLSNDKMTTKFKIYYVFQWTKICKTITRPNWLCQWRGKFWLQWIHKCVVDVWSFETSACCDAFKQGKKWSCRKKGIKMKDGSVLFDQPAESYWWCHYILLPCNDDEAWQDPKFQKEFWLCFCIPNKKIEELVDQMKQSGYFQCWMRCDAFSWKSSPMELLTLATLQYLGHGWTFDDLQEATFINSKTLQQFFHCLWQYGTV